MHKLTSEQTKAVDTIIAHFDVNRVLNVMQALSWRWLINGSLVPPTKPDILLTARRILIEAIKLSESHPEGGYASTGGLEAFCEHNYLTLKFVLTSEEYDMEADEALVIFEETVAKDYESVVKQYARKHCK